MKYTQVILYQQANTNSSSTNTDRTTYNTQTLPKTKRKMSWRLCYQIINSWDLIRLFYTAGSSFLVHRLTGFTNWPDLSVLSPRRCGIELLLVGASQSASHLFIAARPWFCTSKTVASTVPAIVNRSEQWNASLTAIGIELVLWRWKKSDETVASRQGSPIFIKRVYQEARPEVCEGESLTLAIRKEETIDLEVPSIVGSVRAVDIRRCRCLKPLREVIWALPLSCTYVNMLRFR